MHLELTQSAAQDLRTISHYTLETWGEEQQDRYLEGIYRKFEEIIGAPARWRFRNDLFPQCQIAQYSRHIILFVCKGELLTVVRVLHDAMDFERHIPEDY